MLRILGVVGEKIHFSDHFPPKNFHFASAPHPTRLFNQKYYILGD